MTQGKYLLLIALVGGALSACGSDDDDDDANASSGGAANGGKGSHSGGQLAAGGVTHSGGASEQAVTGGQAGEPNTQAGGASNGGHQGSAGHDAGGNDAGATGVAGRTSSGGSSENGGADSAGANNGAASGAHAGGEGGATAEGGAENGAGSFAYVLTLFSKVFPASLNPNSGELSQLPNSPAQIAGSLHSVAVDKSGKFLFVLGEPSHIATYRIADDGSLPATASANIDIADEGPPQSIALDPQGRFAYVGSPFSGLIHSFTLDATGTFTKAGDAITVGRATLRGPDYVAVDPSGHFLYVTQGADPSAPEEDDGIRGYRIDGDSGALSELPHSPYGGSSLIGGAIVFRADGKFLFSSGGGLNAFAIDAESGDLTKVEGSPFTTDVSSDPWAPNIAIDPQGKFVYASNFGATSHLSGFAIQEDGRLQPVPHSPLTTEAPYSIAIEPSGHFLYVGGDDGNVPTFAIRRDTGELDPLPTSQFGGLEPKLAFVPR